MIITRTTQPLHPDDRLALWYMQRSAYLNSPGLGLEVRPAEGSPGGSHASAGLLKINLATHRPPRLGARVTSVSPTDGRKRGTDFSMERSGVESRHAAIERGMTAFERPLVNAQRRDADELCSVGQSRISARPTFLQSATRRLLVTLSFLGSVTGGALWLALALWPFWI